ncbi:aminotransferase class V-fold PLP-dependent enzyme [Muricoccus pecuniae]|uniref:Selenocysteine lyase/cysteine desulfurase n=1 Tax=Muricoccus pecuniae TaxID=693023 RepID=A0A840YNG6_9PROT|nr:aminotransferase class V-fold PLP-dependent enzyme [Roseomonas pecuniae]MBB5696524.1 selenocysteine lyase/cysteine desulfurase [Roseomonas pecuniae]
MSPEEMERLFPNLRGTTYMNTASLAPGCGPAVNALTAAANDWARGRLDWAEAERAGEEARVLFAHLVGGRTDCVALVPTASAVAGLVAAYLPKRFPEGGTILVGEEEFTSNLFPWRLLEARGFALRTLPQRNGGVPAESFERAADGVTRLIAVSAVQSATGYRVDLNHLREVADRSGALLYVDAAQAVGALPLDVTLPRIDALAAPSHKFLLGTRGMGYAYFEPSLRDALEPLWAGWKAAAEPLTSFYGPEMTLSATASRLDMSLAWINALAERESMVVLRGLGAAQVHGHNLGLAALMRQSLLERGVPFLDHGAEHGSTIFACAPRGALVAERLREAGVVAAVRAGRVRLSLHLYNTPEQVRGVAALLGDLR